jgi:VWFA-related protein
MNEMNRSCNHKSFMKLTHTVSMRLTFAALLCCTILIVNVRAQQSQSSSEQADDVVRINTELVQTDVMVFDKAGRFVEGLQKDQFELLVDGKPQPISFFDLIKAGSASEESQLAAARGIPSAPTGRNGDTATRARGRTIFLVLDDLHLAMGNIESTRKLLLHFIDDEMAQNDQAAIISTSGELGLLQQLTADKSVLRAAVARLHFRSRYMVDIEQPPMSEFQAFNIIERNHRATILYFMEETMREYFIGEASVAEAMVRERARVILQKSTIQTLNTLSSLEAIARSAEQVPGRKLVFFISDGFFLTNTQATDVSRRMRRITDAAARSNVVIYTMDARGLFSSMPDASSGVVVDPRNLRASATSGQISASQEPLRTLAAETGGRALINTNALGAGLDKILDETAVYYILAWRPPGENSRGGKFRHIEARIKGRPDLSVRTRKGFFTEGTTQATASRTQGKSAARPQTPDSELISALRSFYPRRTLPVALSLAYMNYPDKGMVLAALVEVNGEAIEPEAEAPGHSVDAIIAVFNDKDNYVSGFRQQLVINRAAEKSTQPSRLSYSQQFRLAPGLYQVRVAARDARDGRTGSAIEWVDIPDLSRGRFSMSSLFIGERSAEDAAQSGGSSTGSTPFRPGRQLAHGSRIGFVTYIYNAAQEGAKGPDVALQVQVFRDDQPVITIPLQKVKTDASTDLKRIPYAAEVNISRLPAGRYILQVTAIDRTSKTTTSQQVNFDIE